MYLGTTFNYNGTFNKAKTKQVLQAKKSTFGLMSKVWQLKLAADTTIYDKRSSLPSGTFCRVFLMSQLLPSPELCGRIYGLTFLS